MSKEKKKNPIEIRYNQLKKEKPEKKKQRRKRIPWVIMEANRNSALNRIGIAFVCIIAVVFIALILLL